MQAEQNPIKTVWGSKHPARRVWQRPARTSE